MNGCSIRRRCRPLRKRTGTAPGSVHGGWYATLLDFALGCAVHTLLPAGRGYTTSQIGTSEARIVGPDGKLYAHATTTCAIFESPSAAS